MKLHILNPTPEIGDLIREEFKGLIDILEYGALNIPFECRNQLSKMYAQGIFAGEDRKIYDKELLFSYLTHYYPNQHVLLFLDGTLTNASPEDGYMRAVNGFYKNGHALVAGDLSTTEQTTTAIHELGHHYGLKHHANCVMNTGHPKPRRFCSVCRQKLENTSTQNL